MIEGVTRSGFKFCVDENFANDMEIVDILADDSIDDSIRASRIVKKLLPGEQRTALYNHLRKDGRVPVDAVVTAVQDIFAAMGNQGKNS